MTEEKITQKSAHFALPLQVRIRAPYLLPMCYTLQELAHRLEIDPQVVKHWMAYGMPQQRDHKGRVWIDGIAFARWVNRVSRRRHLLRLAQDEAHCAQCRTVVKLTQPETKGQGSQRWLEGVCPECSSHIRRALGKRRDRMQNTQE